MNYFTLTGSSDKDLKEHKAMQKINKYLILLIQNLWASTYNNDENINYKMF